MSDLLQDYLPLVVFIAVALFIGVALLVAPFLVAYRQPDPEKLSWMIIGRGSNASDRDQTLLLTAAAALFGDDDESPVRRLAKRVGVDEFALTTGSLTAPSPSIKAAGTSSISLLA